FGEAFVFLGPFLSCGRRQALRLFLLMKSKLLADGVRRRLATMTCCSLFQGVLVLAV
ncbi:Os12g0409800, partial [Oryza sativa Japonica Group]